MASEGWCRACGKWWPLSSAWRLPRHEWRRPDGRAVRCAGSNKLPGKTR